MIKTRSVWSTIKKDDGLRILATRFRGRGLPASQYDVWMPSLGPSEQLLKAVMGGAIDWKTFAKRYRDELFLDGPIDDRSETIKNHGQKSTLRLLKALGDETERHAAVPLRRGREGVSPVPAARRRSELGLSGRPDQVGARISGGGISQAFDFAGDAMRIAATTR